MVPRSRTRFGPHVWCVVFMGMAWTFRIPQFGHDARICIAPPRMWHQDAVLRESETSSSSEIWAAVRLCPNWNTRTHLRPMMP